jgi:hypothetical protein
MRPQGFTHESPNPFPPCRAQRSSDIRENASLDFGKLRRNWKVPANTRLSNRQ